MTLLGEKLNILGTSASAYTTVIAQLGKAHRPDLAEAVVRWMRARSADVPSLQPSAYHYNALIKTYERDRDASGALRTISEMSEWGIKPDIVTYNTALSVFRAAGKLRNALEMMDEMSREGVEPDTCSFNTVLSTCQRQENWQRGSALITRMRLGGIAMDVFTYTTYISLCERCKKWDAAFEIFDQMKLRGVPANLYVYNSLINVCRSAAAVALTSRVRKNYVRRAFDLLRDIEPGTGSSPDLVSYNSLLSVAMTAKQYLVCLDVLDEMEIVGVVPDIVTYSTVIRWVLFVVFLLLSLCVSLCEGVSLC